MRRKQVCYLTDEEAERGEWAEALCSATGVHMTRDRERVSCPLCLIQLESVDRYESDTDMTPDNDMELIPFLLENL